MKIKALGAVGTVTGSSFRLELASGFNALLDCGLFQGGRQTELRNANTGVYDPKNLAALILTHAHMDHSGLVPRLVKAGYRNPVYATEATCDLLRALWLDAANIQEQEAVWKTRKNRRQGQREVEPLYTEDDARLAMTLLKPMTMHEPHQLGPGLTVRFIPAGHILGAASVHFTIEENGTVQRVGFSGDIGRSQQLLMPPPEPLPEVDTLFMETTYGNRNHKELEPSRAELLSVVNRLWAQKKGRLLIPAFAVERTQEILLLLAQAWHEGQIPRELPIILDSPLAAQTSEIYLRHVELFDRSSQDFLRRVMTAEALPSLRVTKDAQESQQLNDLAGPALIIAGSGMANAGRILHHLKHNLWREDCHVVFVGFQAQGTTGRRLVEGATEIKIFRELITVKAKIHTIGGFSGHAGQDELLAWLKRQVHPGLTVNLIHGEPGSTEDFCRLVKATHPEVDFAIPKWLQYVSLAEERPAVAEEEEARPRLADDQAGPSLARRLARLQAQAEAVAGLAPDQLARLESYLAGAEDLLSAAGPNGRRGHGA